jgi:4-hydroxybenzoate polyprenyltransferase
MLPALWLCLSTVGLYGGGVVFNDVFDAELDRVERPERPIPSGEVTVLEAAVLGGLLLVLGIISASLCGFVSGLIAFMIAAFALLYDKAAKHHPVLGPINMGLCRGLNLLLGISIITSALNDLYWLAIIPVIYISSITVISRGEVHGGSRTTLYTASGLYLIVISFILYFSFSQNQLSLTLIFLLPFIWMIFKPLFKAIREPVGKNIGRAVKAGVISLILMNSAWAAAFGSIYIALFIAALLPISLWLSKLFAVT